MVVLWNRTWGEVARLAWTIPLPIVPEAGTICAAWGGKRMRVCGLALARVSLFHEKCPNSGKTQGPTWSACARTDAVLVGDGPARLLKRKD